MNGWMSVYILYLVPLKMDLPTRDSFFGTYKQFEWIQQKKLRLKHLNIML